MHRNSTKLYVHEFGFSSLINVPKVNAPPAGQSRQGKFPNYHYLAFRGGEVGVEVKLCLCDTEAGLLCVHDNIIVGLHNLATP
jgi:hypothetical protein